MTKLRILWALGALSCTLVVADTTNPNDPYPVLMHNYNVSNFFDEFSFFSSADPTNGFVEYQTLEAANSSGIAGIKNNAIYLGSDATTNPPKSTRVQSNFGNYTFGLFIADIARMPNSQCGVWPAFWTVTSGSGTWPVGGEIDIIEGVNDMAGNAVYLHSGPGCKLISKNPPISAKLLTEGLNPKTSEDCNAKGGSTGCGFGRSEGGYGKSFNDAQGGIYAMEWTKNDIRVWNFPRNSIPKDIQSDTPNPMSWPTPQQHFGGGGCDIEQHFQSHEIVINTDFCGDYAGNDAVWKAGSCGAKAKTCKDFVTSNPQAFKDAYWQINSIKVFQSPSKDPWETSNSSSPSSGTNNPVPTEQSSTSPTTSGDTRGLETVGFAAPTPNAVATSIPSAISTVTIGSAIPPFSFTGIPTVTTSSRQTDLPSKQDVDATTVHKAKATANHGILDAGRTGNPPDSQSSIVIPDLGNPRKPFTAVPSTTATSHALPQATDLPKTLFVPRGINWRMGARRHL